MGLLLKIIVVSFFVYFLGQLDDGKFIPIAWSLAIGSVIGIMISYIWG